MQHEQPSFPLFLQLAPTVLDQIRQTIGMLPAETGGILGGSRETGEVTHFVFDAASREQTGVAYTPDNTFLKAIIKADWIPNGINYLGSIHSHQPYYPHPSPGDGLYARRILDALDLPYLLVPIVATIPDTGSFSLFPFIAVRDGAGVNFLEQELIISRGEYPFVKHGKHYLPLPAEALAILTAGVLLIAGIETARLLITRKHIRQREQGA